MQVVTERELVERCRLGDERAFEELVDRFKDLEHADQQIVSVKHS